VISDWIRSFVYGLSLPARSARLLLSKPKLLGLALLPASITVALYWLLLGKFIAWLKPQAFALFQHWGVDPNGWTAGALLFLAQIAIVVAAVLAFSGLCALVAVPFNDFLAEAAERHTEPPLPHTPPLSAARAARAMWIDFCKTLAALVLQVAALFASWLPIINGVAWVLGCLLVTFQFISYPQTRRGIGFRGGASFVGRHVFACLGFGMVYLLLFSIPWFTPVVLPLAVVGGTLLVARAPGSATSDSGDEDGAGLRPLR
jgi:uncharacterized protein involved in cysteine biosynthesis